MLAPYFKLVVCAAVLLVSQQASALNPNIRLQDLNHVSWSEKDGVPGDIQSMAQSRDGWLWLGTSDGLYRFDGVRFDKRPMPRDRINNLHALDNGDLLVSYELEGLTVLHPDGRTEELIDTKATMMGPIASMTMDKEGAIWAASGTGLYRYSKRKWETMSSGPDWAGENFSVLLDQYGRMWASNEKFVYLYDRAGNKLQRLPDPDLHGSLLQSPDGRLWAARADLVRLVPTPPVGQPLPRDPNAAQSESRWGGEFDRDGNLWALKCPYGICRVANAGASTTGLIVPSKQTDDRLDQHWQLSALSTNVVLEDREGNIWVSTQSGIDRFRENKLIPARIPGPTGMYSTASDTEGQLWVAEALNRAVWRVSPEAPPLRDQQRSGSVLANDRDGALLIAGKRDIERLYKGRSTRIPLPAPPGAAPVDLNVIGMLDDGKVLWFASLQTGLMGLVDGKWMPRAHFNLPKRIFMSAAGGPGQLWLSHNDGGLTLYDDGKLSEFNIGMVGTESGIFPGPQLVVGGSAGLAFQQGQRFVQFEPRDAEPLRNVTGMAVTADGDRWLNGSKGVVHIRSADWEASIAQPSLPLTFEVINVLEGYPGRAAMDNRLPTVYNAGNGRLWFRATGGLVRLETAALRPNTVKPVVQLLTVSTGKTGYALRAPATLPPGSSNFSIEYTAPGLRKPEGMRFEYQLEGIDQGWQQAGTRRAAYYTNVGPGQYRFHVRAVNEDGMVGDTVATQTITIAPTVVQTWWFRLLCLLALLLAVYAAYRYRIKIATGAIARQMQARLDERERIARTLHDTFLQSVQSLVLRVSSVTLKLPHDSATRGKLETILDEADRAITEGRDQVHNLRSGQDIEAALNDTGGQLAASHPAVAFAVVVAGVRRTLTVPVQDEFAEIGQEALRNAFAHANAGAVTARIEYAADYFILCVSDNGRGLDAEEARRRQAQRHFGLTGMKERAKRIGAQFEIASEAGLGTTVTAKLPARLAYDRD
jgi:signal transduction histidine kinase/ligand-binding sensor domain-containing protein